MTSLSFSDVDYTFLLNYTSEDIDDIIRDYEQMEKGVRYYYVIDTYDIVENYLPYIDIGIFSKNNKRSQAHKYICYDNFFGNSINQPYTILLDEYNVEILAIKNRLNRYLHNAQAVVENLKSLQSETSNFINHSEKTEDFFNKHLEIIIMLLILDSKKDSILDEFIYFLKERLHISTFKSAESADANILKSIFSESKPSDISIKLFQFFVQNNKSRLRKIKRPDMKYLYLENTYRDIQAIERVIAINKKIQQEGINYKIVYFSSTKKTNRLLEIFKAHSIEKDINIHRNIYQYFLLESLRKDYGYEKAKEILNTFKVLITQKPEERQLTAISDHVKAFLHMVKMLFEEKSQTIDNHFYLQLYEKYRSAYSVNGRATNVEKRKLTPEMIRIIKYIEENRSIYENKLYKLEYSVSKLNQTFKIVDTYKEVENYNPVYRFGKDIIKDPFHHLPYLSLIDRTFVNQKLRDALYKFLNLSSAFSKPEKEKLTTLLNDILKKISELQLEMVQNKLLRDLLITYLNFVAQSQIKKEKEEPGINDDGQHATDNSSELQILDDFEKQYDISETIFGKEDRNLSKQEKKIESDNKKDNFSTEIGYLLIWLYRRNKRVSESIELGIKLHEENKQDPRISHGLGLGYAAKLYENLGLKIGPEKDALYDATLAIEYLRHADEHYKIWFNESRHTDNVKTIIIKSRIAVNNLLADLFLRVIAISKDLNRQYLKAARCHIEEIKDMFNFIDLLYEKSATYNSTEFEIQFYEAKVLLEDNLKELAASKIETAKINASKIPHLPYADVFIDRYFQENTDKMMMELQTKI